MVKEIAGLIVFKNINDNIKYLVLKPIDDTKYWSPPKGRLDCGEDFFAAAVRETQEETGYTMDDLEIYDDKCISLETITKNKGKPKTVKFWLAKLKNAEKEPFLSKNEHSEYRWETKEDAIVKCDSVFSEAFIEFEQKIRNL